MPGCQSLGCRMAEPVSCIALISIYCRVAMALTNGEAQPPLAWRSPAAPGLMRPLPPTLSGVQLMFVMFARCTLIETRDVAHCMVPITCHASSRSSVRSGVRVWKHVRCGCARVLAVSLTAALCHVGTWLRPPCDMW